MLTQHANRFDDWDFTFWDHLKETDFESWGKEYQFDEEERTVFELEVEGLISDCVPADLRGLEASYKLCDWSIPPSNSKVTDVRDAIKTTFSEEEGLDADLVIGNMTGGMTVVDEDFNTVEQPPLAVLGFPKENLVTFLNDLKYNALLTVVTLVRRYPNFLRSLPPKVLQLLPLVEIALHELMHQLKTPKIIAPIATKKIREFVTIPSGWQQSEDGWVLAGPEYVLIFSREAPDDDQCRVTVLRTDRKRPIYDEAFSLLKGMIQKQVTIRPKLYWQVVRAPSPENGWRSRMTGGSLYRADPDDRQDPGIHYALDVSVTLPRLYRS